MAMHSTPVQDVHAFIQTMVSWGVKTCCIGAGSRSTHLIQSMTDHNINIIPFLDERAVGFLALGIIKATQHPVMVVTTSGTAVSNLAPAVAEAANSHLNLIVCSADRPKYLYQSSANQTMVQQSVFPQKLAEIQWPEALPTCKQDLDNALHAMQTIGGPIHINVSLDDPTQTVYQPPTKVDKKAGVAWPQQGAMGPPKVAKVAEFLRAGTRPVLCIAQTEPWVPADTIRNLILRMPWPSVVDVTHMACKTLPNVYRSADVAVAWWRAHPDQAPDRILYCGGPWVSKAMAGYIADFPDKVCHVSESWLPVVPRDTVTMPYANLLDLDQDQLTVHESNVALCNKQAEEALAVSISQEPQSERAFVAQIIDTLPATCDLFVANSMSVRLVDEWVSSRVRHVHVNRGVSGIDGNVATVMGICQEKSDVPLVAIIGDLAALYDLNAFLLKDTIQRPLRVYILNNGGGGIFSTLPIANQYPHFDAHFKCAHGVQLAPILEGMGVSVCQVRKSGEWNVKKQGNLQTRLEVLEILI